METLIEISQKFGSLINITLLLAIIAWLYKIFRFSVTQHKAQIKVLEERIKLKDDLSIDNAAPKIKQAKEFYESFYEASSREWLANSIKQLEAEKEEAIKNNTENFTKQLNGEIEARKSLLKEVKKLTMDLENLKPPAPIDFVGTYTISGSNPKMYKEYLGGLARNRGSYFGKLTIFLPERILTFMVVWEITSSKNTQKHVGTGILVGNTLSVVFNTDLSRAE